MEKQAFVKRLSSCPPREGSAKCTIRRVVVIPLPHADGTPYFSRMPFLAQFETLVDIYQASVRAYANRELFGTKRGSVWQWTTYGEFGSRVEQFRGGLASIGVGAGDVVAIISNNRVEWAIAAYAAFGLGAPIVPMYEAQSDKDREFILRDSGAKVLIVANEAILKRTAHLLEGGKLATIVIIDGTGQGIASEDRVVTFRSLLNKKEQGPIQPNKHDLACLLYTSGTTGNPKGVCLSHYNLASNISAMHQVLPLERSDRSLSFLPWAHIFGQTVELHGLFSMGASIAIAESVDKIIENLAEVEPTVLCSVPRIFNRIYGGVQKQLSEKPQAVQLMVKEALKVTAKERAGERISLPEHLLLSTVEKLVFSKVRAKFGGRLKYAFSGGAAISKDVAEFIDSLGVTVYEGYGLTETSPILTANSPQNRKIGSVGRSIPGVRIEIDTSKSDKVLTGRDKFTKIEGEVVGYGPNIMQGYYNRPEENAAVFTKDGGFRTGDLGYLDPYGYLYITGRIKEQYKLENGKYVSPGPLEEDIKLSPYVANLMIYGDNKSHNVALVVANMDAVREWAGTSGVSVARPELLLEEPRVRQLFRDEIAKRSGEFKAYEEIRDFALISEDFTTENNMLTPSMKLKRRAVWAAYGDKVEALYTKK